MPNTLRIFLPLLLAATTTRADLISHALVRYGDQAPITAEHLGTTAAIATLSYSVPGRFDGSAAATSGYGLLGASAIADASPASYPINFAHAESAFSDTLTISGPTGAGFIIYTYTLTGEATGTAQAALFLRHSTEPDEELSDEIESPCTLISVPHAITFGQPFIFGAILLASASLDQGETGLSAADFSPGAMLTGIDVLDAQMRPLAGYHLTSLSGTDYPIPAPAPLVIFGAMAALSLGRPGRR